MDTDLNVYRHKFQDDVWGQIKLNDLERDAIDTPEFQRLFRTSQLGFVDLVFPTANHTRGAHSIGACHIANGLVDRLNDNTRAAYDNARDGDRDRYANFSISSAERILIRLGALLHDISHIPLSHDLEKKTHRIYYYKDKDLKLPSYYGPYHKHDDYERNPLLYILICDQVNSVLARVLRHYSGAFWAQLQTDAENAILLKEFVDTVSAREAQGWHAEKDLLPQLLFHLLASENQEEALSASLGIALKFGADASPWHIGPTDLSEEEAKKWHRLWYQPFRHDIIGNTLSADLIDYLTRDPERLGTNRKIDLHLLNYYVLAKWKHEQGTDLFRCAIDLHDHKRNIIHTSLLNDLFRLLDLRQEIHEKAVVHRVVQSANAMLSRGMLLLKEPPGIEQLVGFGDDKPPALHGEELLFDRLLDACKHTEEAREDERRGLANARRLFEKLVERRVYRPLLMYSGDVAVHKFSLPSLPRIGVKVEEFQLRTLAAIVDSKYYSFFLLFTSYLIEKYLQGAYDNTDELCQKASYIASHSAPDVLIEAARKLDTQQGNHLDHPV